jgi:N-methylhydantoinase A
VIDVVNNNMEQAVRLISVERGHDPADFALFCFGGAGGLHAADLARALGIPRVIIPRFPGALSALGLLLSDARKDYSRSLLMPAESSQRRIREVRDELHGIGKSEMTSEGFSAKAVHHIDMVDMRYRGQSYELSIPLTRGFIDQFHKAHERRYGYSTPDKPVEIVNVRTSFFGRSKKPEFRAAPKVRGAAKPIEVAMVWMNGRRMKTAIYDRDSLGHGHVVRGPAIIGEYSSTTLVPPDFVCRVDAYLNLVMGSGS